MGKAARWRDAGRRPLQRTRPTLLTVPLDLLLGEFATALATVPDAEPRREARLLVAHALGLDREGLLRLDRRAEVPAEGARALLRRRVDGREPIALITGRRGFWTLDLDVSPATLVPRPDTETVVSLALALTPDSERAWRVLDLGTGTGAIVLALLAERPAAFGIGVDRCEAACRLARNNAERHGLGARTALLCADWADPIAADACFDLIVSNPPYVERDAIALLAPEVARHEPRGALDGGPDGLDGYRAVLPAAARRLAPGGVLVVELGEGQAAAVVALARAINLVPVRTGTDAGGITRALALGRGRAIGEEGLGGAVWVR